MTFTSSLAVSRTWHHCHCVCWAVILVSVLSRGYTFGFFRKIHPAWLIHCNTPCATSSAETQGKGWAEGAAFLAPSTLCRWGEERAGVPRGLLRLKGTRGNPPAIQGTVLALPKKPPVAVHDSVLTLTYPFPCLWCSDVFPFKELITLYCLVSCHLSSIML